MKALLYIGNFCMFCLCQTYIMSVIWCIGSPQWEKTAVIFLTFICRSCIGLYNLLLQKDRQSPCSALLDFVCQELSLIALFVWLCLCCADMMLDMSIIITGMQFKNKSFTHLCLCIISCSVGILTTLFCPSQSQTWY